MKKIMIIVMLFSAPLYAWEGEGMERPPNKPMQQRQQQDQIQVQGQDQNQHQTANAGAIASADATNANTQSVDLGVSTSFEGGDSNNTFNTEAPAPDIILIPNNNTERCLRVIGLSFSNTGGGGGIGWPYRSSKCDFEGAADDAFAQGQQSLGWYWKCQNKNLYKKHKTPEACHAKMLSMLVAPEKPPVAQPVAALVTPQLEVTCSTQNHTDSHGKLLEACVSK